MPPPIVRGGIGSFYFRRAQNRTIRQRYSTGPMYHKRKFFPGIPKHFNIMRKVVPSRTPSGNDPTMEPKWLRHSQLFGDVQRPPVQDYTFKQHQRDDKVECVWKKRGKLQVYQIGGARETFLCFRCGYPVSSRLVAIKSDNWDFRMCYPCYTVVVRQGMENDI